METGRLPAQLLVLSVQLLEHKQMFIYPATRQCFGNFGLIFLAVGMA